MNFFFHIYINVERFYVKQLPVSAVRNLRHYRRECRDRMLRRRSVADCPSKSHLLSSDPPHSHRTRYSTARVHTSLSQCLSHAKRLKYTNVRDQKDSLVKWIHISSQSGIIFPSSTSVLDTCFCYPICSGK